MIIICPNCDARYEVASASLGNTARKVQCANCKTDWMAEPELATDFPTPEVMETPPPPADDKMFDSAEEKQLDAAFERADHEVQSDQPAGTDTDSEPVDIDPEKLAIQRSNLQRRRISINRNLPRARLRRIGRMVLLVALMTLVGGGIFSRQSVVLLVPDLAGLYAAIGLPVNVVGLEFSNVRTVRTTIDGVELIEISGEMGNITGRQVTVPAIIVRLVDESEQVLYEWSVQPQAVALGPGAWMDFSTRLTAPPMAASRLQLSFAEPGSILDAPAAATMTSNE